MKKIIVPILFIAAVVALYEQSKPEKNIFILVAAFVVFMIGMMLLSAKIPSKNQDKEKEDV
ncbi:MAG: hypothetical protein V4548_00920 [Bacteroidota bacterium]